MKVKIGSKFGRLEVLSLVRTEKNNSGKNKHIWLCKCDCGQFCEKASSQLLEAKIPSCGCARKRDLTRRRLYCIWRGMKQRCYGRKWSQHRSYHKNKIKICEEWKNSFENFYVWALSNGYRDDLTIDRIDNSGNYEPSNCRWADKITQQNNTSRNVWIFFDGETHTIAEWRRKLGITPNAMRYRLSKGWGSRASKPEAHI